MAARPYRPMLAARAPELPHPHETCAEVSVKRARAGVGAEHAALVDMGGDELQDRRVLLDEGSLAHVGQRERTTLVRRQERVDHAHVLLVQDGACREDQRARDPNARACRAKDLQLELGKLGGRLAAKTPNDFGVASHGSGAGAWRINEHEVKRIVASDADRLARIDVPKQAGVEGQAASVVGQAVDEPVPGDAGLVADRVDSGYVAGATLADGRLLQKQRLGCPALANLEDARGGCG